MGILADWQIRDEVKIEPFAKASKRKGKISYGLTSYGYDLRLADEYRIFSNSHCAVVDPKNFSDSAFVRHKGPFCIIPPNSFALAESFEYVEIPRDIQTICVGKSTYARCGIIVNVTPLEPEWRGKVTIEISNSTPLPVKVYSGEGILQILFFRADGATQTALSFIEEILKVYHLDTPLGPLASHQRANECETSYADKKGKYQDQKGLELPIVDGCKKRKK